MDQLERRNPSPAPIRELRDLTRYRKLQWWWSVTRLQALLLRDGLSVQAVREHDHLVYHFGGRSGPHPRTARGMDLQPDVVRDWFGGRSVHVIERL